MGNPIDDELAKRNAEGQPSGTDETIDLSDAEMHNNEIGFTATPPLRKENDSE